jgi:iron complex outermembrane receptor protein
MRIDDELVPFELAAFPGRTFYENAGESERNGIEVALGWQNEAGLNAQLSYTFSDFTFEDFVDDAGNDFSGNELPGLPRHFAYLSVGIESVTGVYGTLEFSYSGSLEANNANDVTVDEYLVSNLRLGYRARFGKWLVEPFAGVNNLANESYNSNIRINAFGGRYYEPAPVRHVYAGIVIRYE